MTANEILEDLQEKNFDKVADYVSSAGGCINNGEVTFTKTQLSGFLNDTSDYIWSREDGSGLKIKLTPAEYYSE